MILYFAKIALGLKKKQKNKKKTRFQICNPRLKATCNG